MLLFGKRLKELRTKAGLTQQALGNMINITKVSICCYEKGTRTPTIDTLIDLANTFNVDYSYFLGGDNYVVAEDNQQYGMSMAKDEIELIKELRRHSDLYQKLINDPKRIITLMEKKMR
ncbi:MAG: helix-turn-helix transcriptional regulator [Bacilli bacterium]